MVLNRERVFCANRLQQKLGRKVKNKMRHYKAPNKRIIHRGGNGRFRKTTMQDFGIGGTCPECRHFLIQHYGGMVTLSRIVRQEIDDDVNN